jgi:hypothetical protein
MPCNARSKPHSMLHIFLLQHSALLRLRPPVGHGEQYLREPHCPASHPLQQASPQGSLVWLAGELENGALNLGQLQVGFGAEVCDPVQQLDVVLIHTALPRHEILPQPVSVVCTHLAASLLMQHVARVGSSSCAADMKKLTG